MACGTLKLLLLLLLLLLEEEVEEEEELVLEKFATLAGGVGKRFKSNVCAFPEMASPKESGVTGSA